MLRGNSVSPYIVVFYSLPFDCVRRLRFGRGEEKIWVTVRPHPTDKNNE